MPYDVRTYTTPVQYMAKFNRRTQTMYGFPQHVSTHYDAPSHVCQESPFNDEVALEKFIAPAVIWDIPCKPMEAITPEMLAKCEPKLQPGDYAIIITGGHRLYSDSDRYFLWSPGLPRPRQGHHHRRVRHAHRGGRALRPSGFHRDRLPRPPRLTRTRRSRSPPTGPI